MRANKMKFLPWSQCKNITSYAVVSLLLAFSLSGCKEESRSADGVLPQTPASTQADSGILDTVSISEPSTIILIALGLGGIFFIVKKLKK